MPSFLNKVFGYKKGDDKDASHSSHDAREARDNVLLDGKYEAISPLLSPSAVAFADGQANKDKREVGFSLFRPKSRVRAQKHQHDVPQLSLHLPGPKENSDSRALGIVFEADPQSQMVLDDAVIGAKALNPLEALILVRVCAQAIAERGLETLGIMHPHWFSSSPDIQRKLISLFIHSLTPKSRITTLSPTPASPTSAFENEICYTRSPHDVAAVLRWGLRHLNLENSHFGRDATEWAWYNTFFNAERDASYPPKAFTELLLPQLPTAHIELLTTTLDIIASLASHAEANSISGSKLSKFLGLWLLTATRSEQSDDWTKFYARWERAGRIMEHLFLSRLREESFRQHLPTRLQELVKHYPYNKGSPASEDDLLPRPRFTTRRYDALFVRVESVLVEGAERPKQHPIRLILEAFQLASDAQSGNEHWELWNALKTAASEGSSGTSSSDPEGPQLTRVFVDETIQLLSLIPANSSDPTSPILLASPITKVVSRRRSSSLTKILERKVLKSNGHSGSAVASPVSVSSPIITDWAQFSMSGFGDIPATQPLGSTLLDQDDVEVTQPPVSRKSSPKSGTSRTRRRRSVDHEPLATPATSQLSMSERSIIETKLASVRVIEIDEAFIDFWSDAVVDPISANWPTFVICGLKPIPGVEKPIHWLVIEQTYSRQQPQLSPRGSSPDGPRGRSPRPSFRSDISGFRISSMFTSTRKRFSVFSKSATELTPKKSTGRSPRVGELGEILAEEEPERKPVPSVTNGDTHAKEAVEVPAAVAIIASGAAVEADSQLEANAILTQARSSTAPGFVNQVVISADPISTANREPERGIPISQEIIDLVPVETAGRDIDSSKQQVQELSEVPSVESAPQPKDESGDGSLPLACASAMEDVVVPTEVILAEPRAQPGPEVPSSEVEATAEPQEVAEDTKVLPPAPETVILAGETPGPQIALDTSELAALAQAAEPEVVAIVEEPSLAAVEVVAQVEPDVVPIEEAVQVAVPEVDLGEVPIVDAEPELPVTPVDQVPLVQEPITDPRPQVVDEEPVVRAAPSDDVSETVPAPVVDDAPGPVAKDTQGPASVTADVAEEREPEPDQDKVLESVIEKGQPASVTVDVGEEPVQAEKSEPADAKAPEPVVEVGQALASVTTDAVEGPVQEPAQDPVTEAECVPGPILAEEPSAPAAEESLAVEAVVSRVVTLKTHSSEADASAGQPAEVVEEPVVGAVSEPVEQFDVQSEDEGAAMSHPEATSKLEAGSLAANVGPLLEEEGAAELAPVEATEEVVAEIEETDGATEPVDQCSHDVIDVPVEQPAPVPSEVDASALEPSEPSEDVKPEEET
ncbi:hypothetical protein BS17DRAFT_757214 [Gyrodon lividus]|nr:hypothetical protein BS17DRAFT_757214 [Gyrodon lividus]